MCEHCNPQQVTAVDPVEGSFQALLGALEDHLDEVYDDAFEEGRKAGLNEGAREALTLSQLAESVGLPESDFPEFCGCSDCVQQTGRLPVEQSGLADIVAELFEQQERRLDVLEQRLEDVAQIVKARDPFQDTPLPLADL